MKKVSFLFVFLLISKFSIAQDITQGTWFNEEKDGKIQFFKQGDKIFGKIFWMNRPNDKDGKPRLDVNNTDEKKRIQPLLGLVFLKNFTFNGKNIWEDGEIYDPKNGKTYSSKITMVNPKQLDVRGYIGISLLGRTTHFTKAD
jgi:uncharacterized protein (DUF2147 family)